MPTREAAFARRVAIGTGLNWPSCRGGSPSASAWGRAVGVGLGLAVGVGLGLAVGAGWAQITVKLPRFVPPAIGEFCAWKDKVMLPEMLPLPLQICGTN